MDAHTETFPALHPAPIQRQINVALDADCGAAASARRLLHAIEHGLEPDLMDDLRLLVSELVTNSVRHSEAPAQEKLELEVLVDARTVRVEVRDHGPGFAPRPRSTDRSKPGGWGLHLVDRLTDRWGVVCNHLTHVWFEIDRGGHARLA